MKHQGSHPKPARLNGGRNPRESLWESLVSQQNRWDFWIFIPQMWHFDLSLWPVNVPERPPWTSSFDSPQIRAKAIPRGNHVDICRSDITEIVSTAWWYSSTRNSLLINDAWAPDQTDQNVMDGVGISDRKKNSCPGAYQNLRLIVNGYHWMCYHRHRFWSIMMYLIVWKSVSGDAFTLRNAFSSSWEQSHDWSSPFRKSSIFRCGPVSSSFSRLTSILAGSCWFISKCSIILHSKTFKNHICEVCNPRPSSTTHYISDHHRLVFKVLNFISISPKYGCLWKFDSQISAKPLNCWLAMSPWKNNIKIPPSSLPLLIFAPRFMSGVTFRPHLHGFAPLHCETPGCPSSCQCQPAPAHAAPVRRHGSGGAGGWPRADGLIMFHI